MKKILFIAFAALTLTLGVSAYTDDDDYDEHEGYSIGTEVNQDRIYQEVGTQLYNQDEVISSEAFKQAELSEKHQMLEDHFSKKKVIAYFESLETSATGLAAIFPVGLLAYRYREALNQIPSFIGLGGSIVFSDSLSRGVHRIYEQSSALIHALKKLYLASNAQTDFESKELDYVRNKPWIDEGLHASLEQAFIRLYSGAQDELAQKIITLGLSLPRQPQKITYNNEAIKKTLTYPKQALLGIKRYCIRHVAASGAENVRKVAAYFWGAPGVGKTRAAHLIGKVLDLPCEVISLGNASVADLVGDYDTPGLLLEALTKSAQEGKPNPKNMLLLIDDADRVLLNAAEYGLVSFILTLLEPETKSFYSPFLRANVDISRLGIILAGNAEITEDIALKNRLEIIYFDGHTTEYKKAVVLQELLESLLDIHKDATLAFGLADISPEDTQAINEIVERDADPGFRTLKLNLMNYIEARVLCKYFGQGEDPEVCFSPIMQHAQRNSEDESNNELDYYNDDVDLD